MPADQWELTTAGRAAARVPGALAGAGYYVASDEPKALQTVQEMAAGRAVVTERRLREVHRPIDWSPDYQQQALGYLGGAGPAAGNRLAGFWASLRFPELIEVELSTGQVLRY